MSHSARAKRRPRGQSPVAPRAVRHRGDVDPPSPIHTIPRELLGEIFSFISFSARLKSVSFVCKRWRTAALKSVTRLTLSEVAAEENLEAAIALFPSLTALDLSEVPTLCPAALPPSVHWLRVSFCTSEELEYELRDLRSKRKAKAKAKAEASEVGEDGSGGSGEEEGEEEEEEEDNAEEEEEESIDYSKYDVSATMTVRLIARHTQLTALSLRAIGEDAGAAEELLAPLRLPNLRHLSVKGSFESFAAIIAIAPALQTLKLNDVSMEQFLAAKALLAPLVSVNVPYHNTDDELAAFLDVARTLPNLKRTKPALAVDKDWNPSAPPPIELASDFRVATKSDWGKLRTASHVNALCLQAAGALPAPPPPPLPRLKQLHLGDYKHPWKWPTPIAALSNLLSAFHSVRRVSIWLSAKPRERLDELIALAVLHDVREVTFCARGQPPWIVAEDVEAPKTAQAHGWLRVAHSWAD